MSIKWRLNRSTGNIECMKPYSENRRARFDYELLQQFEAGLVLLGGEVKSIQKGKCDLTGATVLIRNHSAYLLNADIPPYQVGNTPAEYDPRRTRELLLNAKEIAAIEQLVKNSSLTIVPISVYNKNYRIKLHIAVARHKKKSDKRESIKKRETKRTMRRAMR